MSTPDDWDQREVCPDGACIGVIGPDGLCKVCGHAAPNWGDERKRGLRDPEPGEDDEDDEDVAASGEDHATGAPAPDDDTDDYEWKRRRLCPDGACVGVLGSDGRCKVCGRSAA